MNISVDGGGLCLTSRKQFGNYTFSSNILKALDLYDAENNYTVYTFDQCAAEERTEDNNIIYKHLSPKKGWMKVRVSLEEMLHRKHIFLALNQALPFYSEAKIISFSHGLSFLKFPNLYKSDYARLFSQLKEFIKRSEWIIVSSDRVKEDMVAYDQRSAEKIIVLPFGVPFSLHDYEEFERERFFLYAGMDHPIKNIHFIVDSFTNFIQHKDYADYKLYLVGPHKNYASDSIIVKPHMTADELQTYYQKACAYVTASHYESFNLPVLEALSQQCPVIGLESAIIPEMQSYSYIAQDQEEFIEQMKYVASKDQTIINRSHLLEVFSWERYVNRLMELYNV